MKIGSIAIVGAGAVGSYYGCRIAQAGHEVRFLLRSDYEVVREKGFVLESSAGDFQVAEPAVFRDSTELGPVDLVIVAWKATANAHAEEVIAPLLHEETRILTLQNGLGNVELLEGLFGRGRVLGGICFVCINRLAAGHISHTGGGLVTIGEPAETGVLQEVASLFGDLVEMTVVDDLALAQWRKLVWNIPFNGLCVTEGGIDTEELLSRPGKEGEVLATMKEVQLAARTLGHEIPDDFLSNQIERTKPMGPYKPSSMLDYVNGHPLEVEAIWGEPMRRAEKAGVAVPRISALYHRILELDRQR
ncbi:2-dehydropantoate 2-reductase [Roseibacillus persicicus]|uniref:2-dehydropantoate 2-reductase n=1 Tax=Roseibacillus persicicus TaxID=454148 RepID=UPI00280D9356|nr:2-dehydropantoate 2-reductase [Roseibacillus persicicus]MDQ8191761.1 2-dehydropantoate 2-reductase [Roseibacillus persicicus]